MATVSWTEPQAVRGPHEHLEQSNLLVFLGPQRFQLTLWDNRETSPTYRHTLRRVVGGEQPLSILVPAGVVHAFQNLSPERGLSLNLPNRLFRGEQRRADDGAIRHEQDQTTPFKVGGPGIRAKS